MNKPQQFQTACLAIRNTPYVFAVESFEATAHSGGVLGQGQLVWTARVYDSTEDLLSIAAFVDDIGVISLDPRSLMKAD